MPRRTFAARIGNRLLRVLKSLHGQEATENQYDPRFLRVDEFFNRLRYLRRQCKWKVAMTFNMYMDMYPASKDDWKVFLKSNELPWSGIRFVPTPGAKEGYYQLPSLAGMCFLDQRVCDAYQKFLPHKKFEYLPDITDNTLPDEQTQLLSEIRGKAGTRKIVFLGGTLGGTKNLSCWYQLIAQMDSTRWYFVQIGELFEDTLSDEDLYELNKIRARCPENLFIKQMYLPDEAQFNEIINGSDAIFAVYRNFSISSNMLGKAAAFGKPILVARGHLMGDRVLQYGIGMTVVENDVVGMEIALKSLVSNPQLRHDNFEAYRRDFGVIELSRRLCHFLAACIERQSDKNRPLSL
jgi:glycosyltransferase involved in cell wall biosynthesis